MSETLVMDNLDAGDFPRVTREITFGSGAGVIARGTLIGIVTATGYGRTSLTASSDGSQTAYGILLEGIDATSAAAPGVVALTGEFAEDHVILGAGWTITTARAALRPFSIFLKDTLAA